MKHNIIDHNFKQVDSALYQLSILCGMDSLVYSVSDDKGQILVLKSIDFSSTDNKSDWAEKLRNEHLLDLIYRKVKVGMLYPDSTLVPCRLFNEKERNTYLDGLKVGGQNGNAQDDHIESLDIRIVYPPKSDVGQMLSQRFATAKFYNNLTPFLIGCEQKLDSTQEHNAFAHFFDHCFYLSVFEKNRLLFCNTFKHQSASDVMYFSLLAFDQFGLDPENVHFHLSGEIMENSDIYKLLHRYVLHLQLNTLPNFVKAGSKFSIVPEHFYFPLYALSLC